MQYLRAPITEAVIEFRTAADGDIEGAKRKLEKLYPLKEDVIDLDVNFDLAVRSTRVLETKGYKYRSLDAADICQVKPRTAIFSRLSPYNGWDEFSERAKRDWEEVKDIWKRGNVVRIGVRYLNRIDIPKKVFEIHDYLNVYPRRPEMPNIRPMEGYTLQIISTLPGKGRRMIINSGNVPSPLIGYSSFLLDIDVSAEQEVPQSTEDIWKVLSEIRELKNTIFESSITDEARKLFNAAE